MAISDEFRTATIQRLNERGGGTVISIDLRPQKPAFERPTFESIRYPFVTTLAAVFVASLGSARIDLPQPGVHRGVVFLLVGMAALFWLMWAAERIRERRREPVRGDDSLTLDLLGRVLFELGARPLPIQDDPFRR